MGYLTVHGVIELPGLAHGLLSLMGYARQAAFYGRVRSVRTANKRALIEA